MIKRLIVSLFIAINCFPVPAFSASSNVLIYSFRIAGSSVNDEYVEIKNVGNKEVNLFGYRLSKKTALGSNANLLTEFPDVALKPQEVLTIAHADCSHPYDLEYSTSTVIAKNNSIVLYSDRGKTIVDMVGFGEIESNFFEKTALDNLNDGEIYSRKNDTDTDDNRNDFFISYRPPVKEAIKKETKKTNPKNQTTYQPVAKISVSEFMPNPEGPDSEHEFIEIYNSGNKVDISGYFLADLVGSPRKYKIPDGTVIGPKSYLAFFSKKIPISLNNDGDGVVILSPDGKEISFSPDDCGKAPEGASYAFDGKSWQWTSTPTPGAKNVFKPVGKVNSDDKEKEVLSLIDETNLPTEEEIKIQEIKNRNDRILGHILIILAILGGIFYTLYTNKEKAIEIIQNKFRERYNRFREEVRKNRQRG